MNNTFELWDVETGNLIGDFSTAADAFDVVQTLLDAYGPSYANELNLSEREGSKAARVIGSGQQLIDMLDRHDLHASIRAATHTG
jgi:hypothetical protein